MKKLITIAIIALIALVGTASAGLTHGADIWNALGNAPADNPLQLKPGQTIILSYQATNLVNPSGSEAYTYAARALSGGLDSDVTIVFDHDFAPTTSPTYTDVGVIALTLDEGVLNGATYEVTIQVADNDPVFIYGQASRELTAIPEFPTIALPVAAILGLAFFMQRRKEE
ncbi:PEF-CTERM sorting domain-containing protein [Methanolobus psychrotolerans]|uniref:PEF-CTERM sorting domain-containing protein n=1 Tax=Methanolobus psychrotolerans TaxID=1874706 RepID=UPI000B9199F1|nr:PEF-CTERM sorting domain-containing protein [Methanolobus psychrotolerans]